MILPERKQDRIPVPTEEPEEGSTEIGEEFYPDMDEVDEEEVEMEDLLAAAGKDIRLDSTDLIAQEISGLQKMRGREDIPEEEKEGIRSAISKLDGSEFLRMLKENEEKAEKRNRELLKMIEELDNPPMKTGRKSAAGQEKENISLEDFL